jgi:hypothetical protein
MICTAWPWGGLRPKSVARRSAIFTHKALWAATSPDAVSQCAAPSVSLDVADKNSAPNVALNLWHGAWPLAGVAIAVLVNAAWIGLLTYGLVRLL